MFLESTNNRLRRFGIVGFVLVILLYGLFQARDLIQGPVIQIHAPEDGATVTDTLIRIEGEAHNISEITLNERRILVNETGYFNEQLLLPEGYTIMTFEARDRFGRTTKETLQLVRR
jgi:hypothetical protein